MIAFRPTIFDWTMMLSLLLLATFSPLSVAFVPTNVRTAPRSKLSSIVDAPPAESAKYDQEWLNDANENEQIVESKDKFNWFKAWYPLTPVEILDPEIPHRYQLLGMDVVVWRDAAIEGAEFASKKTRKKHVNRVGGEWRVFVDECPHRKVPLSEGRVEDDGTLLCSYHAFRFNGKGECIDIPQLVNHDNFDLERIQKNPKSSCNSFPAQIIDGVLWVWPETGDDARLESALTKAKNYKVADDVDKSRVWHGPWNYRELPYSADYFVENVVDPAHVSVSHHGLVGSRYMDQTQYNEPKESLGKNGFSMITKNSHNSETPATTSYHAPAHVSIEAPFGKDGTMQTLELYATPSRPGFCNHVGRMVVIKDKKGQMPKLLRQFTLPLPIWLNHVFAASFLNQDAVFLHHQERYLAKTGAYISHASSNATNYMDAVFPTQADFGVLKYRSWLNKFAGGFVPYKNSHDHLGEADPDVCFDQWQSHTSKCRYCLQALKNLKRARLASFLVSACIGVLQPAPSKTVNLVGTLSTAGLGFGLNKFIGMFYRQEFSHSQND